MKRDASVELARIAACLGVIGIHTALSVDLNGYYEYGKIFLNCLVTDAVGVFWLILGCFLFQRLDYAKLWTRTARRIVLPAALYLMAYFYLWDWAVLGTTLRESLFHPLEEYLTLAREVLTFQPITTGGGHFWYVYIYLLLMLISPLLKAAAEYLEESAQRQRWFMLLSLGFLAFNDLTNNHMADFSIHAVSAVMPASIAVLWGHLLYRRREWLIQRRGKCMAASAAGFLILNLLRAWVQLYRYETGGLRNKHILWWYTSVGLLCACCVLIFCLCCFVQRKNTGAQKLVCHLASHTFLVYVVHVAVIGALNHHDVILKLHCAVYEWAHGFAGDVLCSLLTIALVFAASLLTAAVVRLAGNGLRRWGRSRAAR